MRGEAETDLLAEIISKCQRGDREGQRKLYELFHRKVFRLASRMVGSGEAPDLTQRVFLRLFQTIGQFSGGSRFETWLYRLAVNECLQHLRQCRSHQHEPLEHEPAGSSVPHTRRVEARDLLDQALARLEPELRAIFLLRELEGFSYRDLADTLQVSEGTVASRLSRARRQLKQILVELGWDA